MATEIVKTYRDQTYGDLYKFRFVQSGSGYNIYILQHPNNSWGGSANDTHILPGNKLCIRRQAKTLDQAIANAMYWIHYFSRYIRTGETRQLQVRAHIRDGKAKR